MQSRGCDGTVQDIQIAHNYVQAKPGLYGYAVWFDLQGDGDWSSFFFDGNQLKADKAGISSSVRVDFDPSSTGTLSTLVFRNNVLSAQFGHYGYYDGTGYEDNLVWQGNYVDVGSVFLRLGSRAKRILVRDNTITRAQSVLYASDGDNVPEVHFYNNMLGEVSAIATNVDRLVSARNYGWDGPLQCTRADVDQNGCVDIRDLAQLASCWLQGCSSDTVLK